jgi:hypothetical protein
MRKKDLHKQEILPLFKIALNENDDRKLINYLSLHSELPGRRANLELGEAFIEVVSDFKSSHSECLYKVILHMLEYTIENAPVNDPKEFIAFCGTWALCSLGVLDSFKNLALTNLKKLATDPRWRIREAVAKAIQILIENNDVLVLDDLQNWLRAKNHWLLMRAVAAGVAEPRILIEEKFVSKALEFHKIIINHITINNERNSEEFKTLRKALGYTLSVVICATPKKGFDYIKRLLQIQDKDIIWIVKNNLKKNRLLKNFPNEVKSLLRILKKSEK